MAFSDELLMRDGKSRQAAAGLLASCSKLFPIDLNPHDSVAATLGDSLFIPDATGAVSAGRQVLGESGVLRLSL